ncbi:MAG: PEP-CTERM sorting domain-containing protein [Akkermansia sp.]|nr:PEP-CTERM sorting domain-containing protein [Akkermansia sp.]
MWDASAGVVYLDHAVPEPASATLSLLALAALAARRRRK